MKKLLLVLTLAFCAPMAFAQNVPSYVPTDGLVGYWGFNGNANDASPNANNGTVNGATLTTDRFGINDKAYDFNGTSDYIRLNNLFNGIAGATSATYNCWALKSINSNNEGVLVSQWVMDDNPSGPIGLFFNITSNDIMEAAMVGGYGFSSSQPAINTSNWNMYTIVYDYSQPLESNRFKFYQNGNLLSLNTSNGLIPSNIGNLSNIASIGARGYAESINGFFSGKLDDIAMYNRALTQEEITALYQGCALSVTTQPTNQTTNISNNAQFNVESSDPDATYQWQTDLGVGFQNISNAGQYSGATTSALTIANTTLINNNQLFRCVIAKASCTDTSSAATLNVNEAIPSNVPTDGLVGYWPFNGNANDESGNNNNGTVNGATLTTDRNGNADSAYSFSGSNISVPITANLHNLPIRTFSCWFYANGEQSGGRIYETTYLNGGIAMSNGNILDAWYYNGANECNVININTGTLNQWHNLVYISDGNTGDGTIYLDGIFNSSRTGVHYNSPQIWQGEFIRFGLGASGEIFNGNIDDIAIYNRALTQEEITNLYYAENSCQSLVINTGVLSFNPPTYNNTVTIYPNPANDHITIDCGNLANVSGWSIKIFNTLGQEVFSGAMNTQQYVVPLNTWSGQGVYFVKIYDASNQLMNTKKIILQ